MTKKAEKEQARKDAIRRLREVIKPGDTVYTVLRDVSRSGMQRRISVVTINRRREPRYWERLVAEAIGEPIPTEEGIKVSGAGMDMGFDLVYRLSTALYGGKRGYPCLGDGCPAAIHSNDYTSPRGKGKGIRHYDDGYAVSQKWI